MDEQLYMSGLEIDELHTIATAFQDLVRVLARQTEYPHPLAIDELQARRDAVKQRQAEEDEARWATALEGDLEEMAF